MPAFYWQSPPRSPAELIIILPQLDWKGWFICSEWSQHLAIKTSCQLAYSAKSCESTAVGRLSQYRTSIVSFGPIWHWEGSSRDWFCVVGRKLSTADTSITKSIIAHWRSDTTLFITWCSVIKFNSFCCEFWLYCTAGWLGSKTPTFRLKLLSFIAVDMTPFWPSAGREAVSGWLTDHDWLSSFVRSVFA